MNRVIFVTWLSSGDREATERSNVENNCSLSCIQLGGSITRRSAGLVALHIAAFHCRLCSSTQLSSYVLASWHARKQLLRLCVFHRTFQDRSREGTQMVSACRPSPSPANLFVPNQNAIPSLLSFEVSNHEALLVLVFMFNASRHNSIMISTVK